MKKILLILVLGSWFGLKHAGDLMQLANRDTIEKQTHDAVKKSGRICKTPCVKKQQQATIFDSMIFSAMAL
jgi:hypothetical protein